jgi:transcriptional regulator with XRE-family HTH domain
MCKKETCGKRIEKALMIREMKQADLCKLADIPKSSLSLYLKGAYEPKQDKIYKMANALNFSEMWLMGYDVPMHRVEQSTSSELTSAERVMLELFRRVPETQQKILIQLIRDGLRNQG